MTHVSANEFRRWGRDVFTAAGLPLEDASRTAQQLVQTSLWGIDSHGVARITHYLNRLAHGSIQAKPRLVFTRTAAGTGTLDGGDGLGFVVCSRATDEAAALAREAGVGAVGVFNSSHCGAIGLYTRSLASQGLIGIAFTHSDSFVAPHLGTKPFFGTNPLSIGLPTQNPSRPFCVDMATSIVPWNRVMNARRENKPLPETWAMDENGKPTTDAHDARALRPMAEHKGYALAFAIDMLCGPLNGMNFGPHLTKMYDNLDQPRRLGSFILALDPSRFHGGAVLAAVLTAAIAEVKSQGPEIQSPGDPEYASADKREVSGIPVEPEQQRDIVEWSRKLGVRPPLFENVFAS